MSRFTRSSRWRGDNAWNKTKDEGAHAVGDDVPDMRGKRIIELARRLGALHLFCGAHLAQHVRMAADRPLAEDDEGPRQDVGAFHGDGDRRHLVAAADPVVRSEADALAAVDVHRIVHAEPGAL